MAMPSEARPVNSTIIRSKFRRTLTPKPVVTPIIMRHILALWLVLDPISPAPEHTDRMQGKSMLEVMSKTKPVTVRPCR